MTAIILAQPLAMHSVWLRSIAPYDETQPVDSDRFYHAYIEFVLNYSTVLNKATRVPSAEGYILMAQQFLLGSDPCVALVIVPNCDAPPIDPGPDAAGPGVYPAPGQG